MKRDNGDLNLFKLVGVLLVLFYLFVFIGVNFVTVGVKDAKPIEYKSDYLNQKMELRDAEILGKFWNDKGHFIVVYDEDTKAPELFQIDFSEWNLISVGDTY